MQDWTVVSDVETKVLDTLLKYRYCGCPGLPESHDEVISGIMRDKYELGLRKHYHGCCKSEFVPKVSYRC